MYENYWYWDGSEWYYYQQGGMKAKGWVLLADGCLLYTSPSPRDRG